MDVSSPCARYSAPQPQRMTEQNLREFDQLTRRDRGSTRTDRDRPMSPGASSIKSSRKWSPLTFNTESDVRLNMCSHSAM